MSGVAVALAERAAHVGSDVGELVRRELDQDEPPVPDVADAKVETAVRLAERDSRIFQGGVDEGRLFRRSAAFFSEDGGNNGLRAWPDASVPGRSTPAPGPAPLR